MKRRIASVRTNSDYPFLCLDVVVVANRVGVLRCRRGLVRAIEPRPAISLALANGNHSPAVGSSGKLTFASSSRMPSSWMLQTTGPFFVMVIHMM